MGRLILPERQEMIHQAGDGAWVELEQAPPAHKEWIGHRLRLGWQETSTITNLIDLVSTDIHFGAAAAKLAQQGNVLPTRLDGLKSVGPLKSLAGARPHDDVTVKLEGVVTDKELSTESPPDGESIPSHRATPNSDHRSMERFSEHSWP